jgi:peptide/nickel transport system substrate-binding protein
MALAALVALFALAACGGDSDTTAAPSTAAPAAAPQQPAAPAAAPQPEGITAAAVAPQQPDAPAMPVDTSDTMMAMEPKVERVIIAFPAPSTEGNDSNFDFSSPPSVQLRPMYDYLVGVNAETGAFEPQLATEWSVEPDGLGIRFKLREGIQFHNGWGEFTTKDVQHVAWSISRDDSLHGLASQFRREIDEIQAVSDHELVVRLGRANPGNFNGISQLIGGWEIQSKDMYNEVGQPTLADEPIVGTGPYEFKEREQGQYVRFERGSTAHWRTTPDFPELEIRWTSEASTRLAALLTGEIHLTPIPSDLEAQAIGADRRMVQGKVPGFRTFFNFQGSWWVDHGDPASGRKFPDSPLLNQNVRKALSKAIDRAALNEAFFGNEAEQAVHSHFHPSRLGWNAAWVNGFDAEYDYDPAAARAALAEAGYNADNPLETNLHLINLTTYAGSLDLIESVQGFYSDIGVKANLITLDPATRNAQTRAHEFDNHIGLVSTSSDIFLAARVYMTSSHPSAANYQEAEMNGYYREATSTLSLEAQDVALRKLGDRSFAVNQSIPLFWIPAKIAIDPSVVADYVFPGNISGTWTHLYNIRAS